MSKGIFNKRTRGLDYYNKLKNFSEKANTMDIGRFEDVALFVRNVIIEKNNSKAFAYELNRYDLIIEISVNPSFPERNIISFDLEACLQIASKIGKSINVDSFLSSPLVKLKDNTYTLQEFISSIAYNGVIHWQPTTDPSKPDLELLYEEFICKYEDTALRMITDIAKCLVKAYDPIFDIYQGNMHGFCTSQFHRPVIVKQGKLIENGNGDTCALYQKSYTQVPIEKITNCGIRLGFNIQLIHLERPGFIFVYGNRNNEEINIACEQTSKYLLIKTVTTGKRKSTLNKIVKIPIKTTWYSKPFQLEVTLYPNGILRIGIDEYLVNASVKVPTNFNIYDGRLMLGSNLEKKMFGNFLLAEITVQKLDKRNRVHTVRLYSCNRQLTPVNNRSLPPNIVKRPLF